MMCQCRFINCHKHTTPMGHADSGGGYACVGAGVYKTSLPFDQFYHEDKTALKYKGFFFFLRRVDKH